jgi:uncharacterized protein YdaU (DUF1376 family)
MTLPYYPFYWGDYNAKTIDLTRGQHASYFLLLNFFYCTGRRVKHDNRFSITKALLKQEMDDTDFVLGLFFKKRGDEWCNFRAESVMQEWNEKHQRRVIAGKKPKKLPEQYSSNTQAIPKQPEPEPEPVKKEDTTYLPKKDYRNGKSKPNSIANGLDLVRQHIENLKIEADREADAHREINLLTENG